MPSTATHLSSTSGDVTTGAAAGMHERPSSGGQFLYEGPRLAPDQTQPAASTFPERATHNAFNTVLGPDMEPGTEACNRQAVTVQITDRGGNQASVTARPDEPALGYRAGRMRADEFIPGFFTGILPLTTVRIPLIQFSGIDPTAITEITIQPDTPRGALFLADVELTR